MNDFSQAIQILKDLGVIQIFSIPFAFLVFLYLFKKFVFNGAGENVAKIGAFFNTLITELMNNEKDRIKTQMAIQQTLEDLCQKFQETPRELASLEKALREHIAETRNLLLLLKQRSDPIKIALADVDTQYLKAEKP